VEMTAAEDMATAWPAEQAEEALRRIVTVILHGPGPTGFREMAVLCLACDALGIDEPIMVSDPAGPLRFRRSASCGESGSNPVSPTSKALTA
jgi:hypothetical protein